MLCSVASFSFGQHEIGVKAGYNLLFTNYNNPLEIEGIETDGGGYHFGGYYSYTPMDNLFLSGELLISNRSWNEIVRSNHEGSIQTLEEVYTYYSNTYLEIPLSIKYGINMRRTRYGGNKYLLFYAGPSAHLLMGTKGSSQETFRVDAYGQTTVVQEEEIYAKSDLKEYFSPFQMGVHAGVGFSFDFGLTLDARYQTMLMPTNRADVQDLLLGDGKGSIKQGMLMFSVGYSFFRD